MACAKKQEQYKEDMPHGMVGNMKIKMVTSIVFLSVIFSGCILCFFTLGEKLFKVGKNTSVSDNNVLTENATIVPDNTDKSRRTIFEKMGVYINTINNFTTETITQNIVGQTAVGEYIKLTYAVTGKIDGGNVLSGKDDWLFYQSKTDGDSIADFCGTNLLSEKDMKYCLEIAEAVKDYFDRQGIKFILMIPPNKEQIYFDKMPDVILKYGQSKTSLLVEYFRKNSDIPVVYPYENLIDAKMDYQVYYKYDTHWNYLGAFIGEQELLRTLSLPSSALPEHSISISDEQPDKDLARMVGLEDMFNDDRKYVVDDYPIIKLERNVETGANTNALAGNSLSVLFVGDSFRIAMLPYLFNDFQWVLQTHYEAYHSTLFEQAKPDIVVWEWAERTTSVSAFEEMAKLLLPK